MEYNLFKEHSRIAFFNSYLAILVKEYLKNPLKVNKSQINNLETFMPELIKQAEIVTKIYIDRFSE